MTMIGHSVMKGRSSSTSAALWLALIVIISFEVLFASTANCKVLQQQQPAAMFVFGDGMLDVGNNNYLNSTEEFGEPLRADHPYYGVDFPNSEATGRFSNGYNMADFVAKALGLGIVSPRAYLSPAVPISMENFTGGNYASERARIWDLFDEDDGTQVTIPLRKQVDSFAATKAAMEQKLGGRELKKLIPKSVFLLSFGTKDLFHVWYLQNLRAMDKQTSVQYLLSSYGAGIEALFHAGARKFAVVNVPPIGCAPAGQMPWRGRGYVRGRCDESKNKLATEFNDGLGRLLANLSSHLHGFRYSLADFYGFANATFANPSAAGFVNVNTECCKSPCMAADVSDDGPGPCENREQYWFWDESYLTEEAAKLAAAAFCNGGPPQFTVPLNFNKLVHTK